MTQVCTKRILHYSDQPKYFLTLFNVLRRFLYFQQYSVFVTIQLILTELLQLIPFVFKMATTLLNVVFCGLDAVIPQVQYNLLDHIQNYLMRN